MQMKVKMQMPFWFWEKLFAYCVLCHLFRS